MASWLLRMSTGDGEGPVFEGKGEERKRGGVEEEEQHARHLCVCVWERESVCVREHLCVKEDAKEA